MDKDLVLMRAAIQCAGQISQGPIPSATTADTAQETKMATLTDDFKFKGAKSKRIASALQSTLDRANNGNVSIASASFELDSDRYLIFSDLHKGARNGADDFWRSERVYNAALAYYLEMEYTLILLGDIKELWEERSRAVLKAYKRTIKLEAHFYRQDRYYRIRGNHDDEWQYARSMKHFLDPVFRPPVLQVYESLLLTVVDGTYEPLGSIFLVHGHQGTTLSERWAGISKTLVRYFWRPIQRLTHWSFNTPATKLELRHRYERMLYDWAASQANFVLITGHTHRPVFRSTSHEAKLQDELTALREAAGDSPTREQKERIAELLAEIEWVAAQQMQRPDSERWEKGARKPCYFNTGCCCYYDGDITGLEIAEGEIRLVRWPNDDGNPRRKFLDRAPLSGILAAC
jgi:UDP-2,3-diacylglucosamine pyrophosphatase LpxH